MNFKSFIFIFILAVILFPVLSRCADIQELLAESDSLYRAFDNRAAQAYYLEALALDSNNAEILWRLSRTQVDIGEHLLEEEQEPYFQKAADYADRAIGLEPQNPQGHLRRAIALGKLALHKGVFKSISLVKQVRQSLDQCLKLAPLEPTAHYVMGRTHHKLCEKPKIARGILGLGWADMDIAREEYEKAIDIDPNFIMYRLDYAKLLMEVKNYPEARVQLETILRLPIRDEDDSDKIVEAQELLKNENLR